jgi:hypothetical protein
VSVYPINAFLFPLPDKFLPKTTTGAEPGASQYPRCNIDNGDEFLIPRYVPISAPPLAEIPTQPIEPVHEILQH